MPLRYLQLPEAQYIPKYQQLNTSLLNVVDTQIEGQIQQGRQQLDAFDAMVDTTAQQLNTLPESYRQSFQEMANRTKSELNASVEERGYRNIQGKVRNLSRQFMTESAPILQTAAKVETANKIINDSKAGGVYKGVAKQAIQQALESGEEFKIPEVVSAFENWRDLYADVNELSKGWEGSTQAIETLKESPYGDYIYRALQETGRANEFQEAALARLMSDPQAFRQLEIMAQTFGLESTPENIATVAASIIEPNVIKLKYQKENNIQRMEQDAQSFMGSLMPTVGIGVQADPALQSIEGFTEAMEGYDSQINLLTSNLNDYIKNSAFEYPQYKNAKVKWNENNKEYEIIAADGKTKINSPTALSMSSQREYFDSVQKNRIIELDKATKEATNSQYKTYNEFIKNNPSATESIAKARRRVESGRTAQRRDPLTSLIDNLFGSTEKEKTSRDEARILKIAASLSPELGKINQILQTKYSDKELPISPISVSKLETEAMESVWNTLANTNVVFDKNGNEVRNEEGKQPQIPSKAKFLGYAYTPKGMEFVWSAEPEKEKDGTVIIPGGIFRTIPNGNQVSALVIKGRQSKGVEVSVYNTLAQLADPASPVKEQSYPVQDKNGKTYNFNVYYDNTDNVYRLRLPDEIAVAENQYYQTYRNVDEVTNALMRLMTRSARK